MIDKVCYDRFVADRRPIDPTIAQPLQTAELLAYYSNLPPSHQKEYEVWILAAKKPETKDKRITKMITMLREKQGEKH